MGQVGVEVADAYNRRVAQILWGHARGKEVPPIAFSGFINPDAELVAAIQKTVAKHCRNTYSTPVTYLVINCSHAPLTDAEDAAFLMSHLFIPDDSSFIASYLRLAQAYNRGCDFYKLRTG